MPFSSILRQNSSKSLLNSGSFSLFCIGTKSDPIFSIRISVSVKTFRHKLKTVSQKKDPSKLSSLAAPYLGYVKEVLMFCRDSKCTVFSSGVQALGCLAVEPVLLETLASLTLASFSILEKPESCFN